MTSFYFTRKNWVARVLADDQVLAAPEALELPEHIKQFAESDRVGVWRRGNDEHESSCRNALALIGKGWTLVGLADEQRRRAEAEARPWPPAAQSEPPAAQKLEAKGRK